jgi:hypothetical protein
MRREETMKSLWMKRISWLIVFLVIIFLAGEIEARRGGGGGGRGGGGHSRGGGGSKSYSRSSPAKSGSLGRGSSYSRTSSSKSYSRKSPAKSGSLGGYSSSRKTTTSRSEIKSKGETKKIGERQTSRQTATKDLQSQRTKSAEDLQKNRQEWKDANREDWQDYGKNRQEDRQDFARDYGEHNDWDDWHDGGEWHGGEAWEFVGTAAAISIGTALTVNAINSMSCAMSSVYVGGVSYYSCGGYWYNRGYQNGNVVYVVVNPPAGY